MWVEFIEIFMEKCMPAKWEEYQRARYDYEGYIFRWDIRSPRGAELWGPCPGKRLRAVEVVELIEPDGRRKRLRVRDHA